LIVGVTIGAVAEALLLAEAGGADPVAVRSALLGGFADSTVLRQHGERMTLRNFVPGAKSEIQDKDLRTAMVLGETLGVTLPLTHCAGALFADFCRAGGAQLDHSALYLHLKQSMSRI
jgi:2-hydroxy-3-oxopropionate reductase